MHCVLYYIGEEWASKERSVGDVVKLRGVEDYEWGERVVEDCVCVWGGGSRGLCVWGRGRVVEDCVCVCVWGVFLQDLCFLTKAYKS